MRLIKLSILAMIFPVLAFADEVEVPIQDVVNQALQLGRDWKTLGIWAALALVVKILVDATKTKLLGGLFKKLPDGAQILLVLALSTVSVGFAVLSTGGSWMDVVSAVLQSSSAAMLLNEVLKRVVGIGAKAEVSILKKE